jgi:perosamine synthetase
MLGYKFKISNVQAAIGCAQVDRIAELIGRKREIFESYHSGLGHCEGLQMNPEPDGTVNGYWMPTVVFDKSLGLTRDRILAAFRSQNIDARVFFSPLSSLDMFESQKQNSNSYSIAERAINLPSFHDITFQEIERVIAVVRDLAS